MAKTPACTQPIQDVVRSWIRGKRAWFGGGGEGKTYFTVPARAFLGKCPAGMTYPLKEVRKS